MTSVSDRGNIYKKVITLSGSQTDQTLTVPRVRVFTQLAVWRRGWWVCAAVWLRDLWTFEPSETGMLLRTFKQRLKKYR